MDDPIRLDSGRLCLDLLATLGNREHERLPDGKALARWLGAAGLHGDADLADVRRLRAAVLALVDAELEGRPADPGAVDEVNARARAPRLALEAGRVVALRGGALEAIALDAVDLFAGPDRERLRECAAPDCSGMFVDASRGGRRRWCSSARCGNRARVAAHYARRAT